MTEFLFKFLNILRILAYKMYDLLKSFAHVNVWCGRERGRVGVRFWLSPLFACFLHLLLIVVEKLDKEQS